MLNNIIRKRYYLPAYLSLLFFLLGFILSYKWKAISMVSAIIGTILLSLIIGYFSARYPLSKTLFNLIIATNFMAALFLLGIHADCKKENDKHFGKLKPKTLRWLVAPSITLFMFYLIVVILCAKEGGGWGVLAIYHYLSKNIFFFILLISWFIFILNP